MATESAITYYGGNEDAPVDMLDLFEKTKYLVTFNELASDMRANGVDLFAVCAEPQDQAEEMMKRHSLHYTCYSDPKHNLRNYIGEKNYIDVKVSGGQNSTEEFYTKHKFIGRYKHGIVQPGVLCITKEKKVLFSWAIEPLTSNYAGAKDRPEPVNIWEIVKRKLDNPEAADNPVDYSSIPIQTLK